MELSPPLASSSCPCIRVVQNGPVVLQHLVSVPSDSTSLKFPNVLCGSQCTSSEEETDNDSSENEGYLAAAAIKRSESERQPARMAEDSERRNVERSKSDRRQQLIEQNPTSPSKSDTLRSTDSASGGETLEERSSKEGSPTKEHPSPTKEKKKKKKFRIPSFSKKKNKESKESAI
ncbi:hypothetical protein RRG08_004593 [Elysia crispata]|uniref:Uncharacterized protein n=1 Tax=Elysia crispata TaxID=231223 RepID=A0AAE1E1L9_9GAST|nr:hypothetical protein RRG08_004593 [Elysia crispata]